MKSDANVVGIPKWMCHDLKLSGNELTIFLYIYNVCQSDIVPCKSVSVTDIMNYLNLDERTVRRNIDSLLSRQYISKRKHGKSMVYYPTVEDHKHSGALFDVKPKRSKVKSSMAELREERYIQVTEFVCCNGGGNAELEDILREYINNVCTKKDDLSEDVWKRKLDGLYNRCKGNIDDMIESVANAIEGTYPRFYAPNKQYNSYKSVEKISKYETEQEDIKYV